jgi:formate hydrogenlyase subunit 3/multisubunit Na+/H+ antiporter MnhD subunit
MIKVGFRKYSAFILSLVAYCVLFLVVVLNGSVKNENIPTFAFQLGLGISAVVGVFYAGNVLGKKVGSNEQ